MIQSLQDYKYYLEQDKLALGIPDNVKRPRLGTDDVWRWERLLRKREYITNCKNGLFWKIYREWIRFRFHRSSVRLGFSIPINTFINLTGGRLRLMEEQESVKIVEFKKA